MPPRFVGALRLSPFCRAYRHKLHIGYTVSVSLILDHKLLSHD